MAFIFANLVMESLYVPIDLMPVPHPKQVHPSRISSVLKQVFFCGFKGLLALFILFVNKCSFRGSGARSTYEPPACSLHLGRAEEIHELFLYKLSASN